MTLLRSFAIGLCDLLRCSTISRTQHCLQVGKSERAVMIEQPQNTACVAFMTISVAPYTATIHGKGLAAELLAIDENRRKRIAIADTANSVRVLLLLGIFRDLVAKDLADTTMMAHSQVFGQKLFKIALNRLGRA